MYTTYVFNIKKNIFSKKTKIQEIEELLEIKFKKKFERKDKTKVIYDSEIGMGLYE